MPLEIYRRGKIWHYRGTVGPNGRRRRLRGSCRTADKATAERYTSEIETNYWKGHFDGPAAILTFERACLNYKAAGKSDRFLDLPREKFGQTLVREITPQAIQAFTMEHFGHCAGSSRNRMGIQPIVTVINHNAKSGLCSPLKVERYKEDKREVREASMEWIMAFRRVAPPLLWSYALFMFLTGARPSEALAVDREKDLDLQRALVTIRETKVSKERVSHLPPLLVATLANMPVVEGRPLFGYRYYDHMKGQWDFYARKAKIEALTPKACRHGFATTLLRRGIDVVTVAWLGGWATPAMVLKTYGHAIKRRDLTNVLVDPLLTQAIEEVVETAKFSVPSFSL